MILPISHRRQEILLKEILEQDPNFFGKRHSATVTRLWRKKSQMNLLVLDDCGARGFHPRPIVVRRRRKSCLRTV